MLEMSEKAKMARRAYQQEWRDKNHDHILEYNREWRKNNQDKLKAATIAYWERKAAEREK